MCHATTPTSARQCWAACGNVQCLPKECPGAGGARRPGSTAPRSSHTRRPPVAGPSARALSAAAPVPVAVLEETRRLPGMNEATGRRPKTLFRLLEFHILELDHPALGFQSEVA